jgi:UPF0176 protein
MTDESKGYRSSHTMKHIKIPFTMANETGTDTDTNTVSESPSSSTYCILAFYKFVQTTPLPPSNEISVLRSEIESVFRQHHARGNVLLAPEGINGTVCYPLPDRLLDDANKSVPDNSSKSHNAVLEFLTTRFKGIRTRISWSSSAVFTRLKIRIKSEIVTMGKVLLPADNSIIDTEFDSVIDSSGVEADRGCSSSAGASSSCLRQSPGEHVPADQWNALLQNPNVLVVDTRNEYEIAIGTFLNAVNPHTESFLEFPDWLDQYLVQQQTKQERPITGIAMFCTGGIRCEKATAYCRQVLAEKSILTPESSQQDQQQSEIDDEHDRHVHSIPSATATTTTNAIPVYHLEGGILAYLDMIPPEESLFEGDCFVFDQRIAVQTGLQPAPNYASCHACRSVLRPVDLQSDKYEAGISCPACWDTRAERQERYRERQWQMMLSQQKGIPHLHDAKEFTIATAAKETAKCRNDLGNTPKLESSEYKRE